MTLDLSRLPKDELSVLADLLSKAQTDADKSDPRTFPPEQLAAEAMRVPNVAKSIAIAAFSSLLPMLLAEVEKLIKRKISPLPKLDPAVPYVQPATGYAPTFTPSEHPPAWTPPADRPGGGPMPTPVLVNGVWTLPSATPPTPVWVNGAWTLPSQGQPGQPAPAPGFQTPAASGKLPDETGLNIKEVFGPNRTGRVQRTFTVSEEPVDGHYELKMSDGTTSLDDQSGVLVEGILFIAGRGVKIEEVPGAADRLYWKSTNNDTGAVNKLSIVNGEWRADGQEKASNWRVDEAQRTRGFEVPLHFHDKSLSGYDITFGVEGGFEAVPIRTPAVR